MEELERAITRQEIFLASSGSVNDPFEFSPVFVKSPLRELNLDIKKAESFRGPLVRGRMSEIQGRPVPRSEYQKYKKSVKGPIARAELEHRATLLSLQKAKSKARLACFSETASIIPMWAHYANHTGVCIVFGFNLGDVSEPHDFLPLQVKYSKERPILSTMDVRVFTGRAAKEANSESIRDKVFNGLFFSKANDWSYEREWRIVDTSGARAGYVKVTALRVEALLFGINSKGSRIQECLSKFGDDVPMFRSFVSTDKFDLDFKKVVLKQG
jgi:hypothetical protein